jgi:uncharacterized protein
VSRNVTIRDPIHGTLHVTKAERAVIDTRAVQRLRQVRQLGFADLAFPGATHSRYSHSLGAMHIAGRMAETVLASLPEADREELTSFVRLGALLHDVGHAPLSHTSERLMPNVSDLALPAWAVEPDKVQATHEDYTVLLLLSSHLTHAIDRNFGDGAAKKVAAIVAGRHDGPSPFVIGGVDYFPVLRQMVSSELDVDRMDYLLRDSFYTGVNYGKYDLDWLCQHGRMHIEDNAAHLAIESRAIFAFEDFLLSRLHMFLAVYYHYVPVGFDHLMQRYAEDAMGEYEFPREAEAYVERDDVHFVSALRQSNNPWANLLSTRRGYRLLVETTERDKPIPKPKIMAALEEARISSFETTSTGGLSKYFHSDATPLYVINEMLGQVTPLEHYTPLFRRYEEDVLVWRIYVAPDAYDAAQGLLKRVMSAR